MSMYKKNVPYLTAGTELTDEGKEKLQIHLHVCGQIWWVYVHSVHASCMFMWGVSGLSSQHSLMPLRPGQRLDGITGNWIVFHLLWRQPGRDTPSPPIPPPSHHSPPIPAIPPVPIPLLRHVAPNPLLLHVIQSFPLRCRNAGLDVSRVLNKAAACTIPAAAATEIQHCVVYHPNGVEQYA